MAGQFFLEIAGLIGVARLGWQLFNGGVVGVALASLLVALASAIWAIFRTPGFVPNGGDPIVATPGPVRLAIELMFFALASWGLWLSGWELASGVMLVCIVLVYWATRDRTVGLLRNRPSGT
jgi:hypothetical protein